MSLWFLFQGAGALPNTRNHGRGFAVPVLQCMGTGKPMLLLRASLDTCIAPSCDRENFDGPGEAVYSYGQTFLMALHREDGCSSHTGRFKQEQLNPGTFPACVEPYGAGWRSLAIASSQALPFPSPATTFSHLWPHSRLQPRLLQEVLEGKGSVILSFPERSALRFCREQRRGSARRRSAASSSALWSCWWGLSACASPSSSAASSPMSTRSPW